jgi:anaerobic selenocysteine-containing dehydrogenase
MAPNRRDFAKGSAVAAVATIAGPQLLKAAPMRVKDFNFASLSDAV